MVGNWCLPSCEGQIIVLKRSAISHPTSCGVIRYTQIRTFRSLITSMIASCTISHWGGLYVISLSPTSQPVDEPTSNGSARRFVNEVYEFKVYISVEA